MNLKSLPLLLLLLTLSSIAISQNQDPGDVIFLKDGSFIKGSIMEYKVNEHVRIKTLEGKVQEYDVANLKKIKNRGFSSIKFFTPQKSGYFNVTTLGFTSYRGSYSDIISTPAFETINGYQFGSKYLVGLGTGLEVMERRGFAPVFADFKYMFRTSKFSPYVGARAGYMIAFPETGNGNNFWGGYVPPKYHGGAIAGVEAGIRGYLGNRIGMIFGIEYRFQQDRAEISDSFWNGEDYISFPVTEITNMHKFGMKLGIIFH